jgi:hypothetical protein
MIFDGWNRFVLPSFTPKPSVDVSCLDGLAVKGFAK